MAKKNPPAKKQVKRDPDDTEDQDKDNEENEDEDEDEDSEAENRRINAIVTSRVKREMKPVLAQLATISESLTKLSTPKKEDDEDEDGEDGDKEEKQAQPDVKTTRKLTKLEKELAEEKAARKKAEQERAEELERGKKTEMRTIFDSALNELGCVDPILRKAAVRELEEAGVMIRDESGKVKFRGQDKYGIETDFDPKVGLKSWIATEGKSFVPAVDAGGSGTGGTTRGIGNTNLTSKEISKLSDQQKASINLERACSGLPPLE